MEATDRPAKRAARVSVRPIAENEYEAVLPLISGYQRFYEAEPDDERNRTFFRRFLAPSDDGILGPVRFDRNGDLIAPAVTIMRVRARDGVSDVVDLEGATIDRVISPSATAVR